MVSLDIAQRDFIVLQVNEYKTAPKAIQYICMSLLQ